MALDISEAKRTPGSRPRGSERGVKGAEKQRRSKTGKGGANQKTKNRWGRPCLKRVGPRVTGKLV